MKFKKVIAPLILSCLLLSGCSTSTKKDISTDAIKENVSSVISSEYNVQSIPAAEHWIFDSVKDKIIEGYVSQALINVHLHDVIVVKTDYPDEIKAAIETYKTENLKLFEGGYGGEHNATSVANAKLNSVNNIVYFIAAPDSDKIEEAILNTK